ncbi:class I SAM-dependent methyltransferase [Streptantibioticus ferralitis]|uniref:Methyltransferase domain-containing protein n=1 Tax=Streptantibioticus ferralitis TaxID=236510 RepID=A0ABT5Z993_9ACTN|nr:class I SAM-dependent methyltransferase [Streptantibioticus ferralitis]MDF2260131.1 methyltransferase domain-containing protein [Streptantibioticus ferralitis]
MNSDRPASTNRYRTGMLGKNAPQERTRLESIQQSVDSRTIAIIQDLSITPSWRCLELGAGAGSIAYWLAGRCPDGEVVAVDIDTQHLDADRAANLVVQKADIIHEDYPPASFDLIHARYLLCHLPERDEIIERAAGWLAPGGWLVIEDPYQLPADTSPFPVVQRLMAAYERKYNEHGADLTWARGVPAVLARSGLGDVGFAGNLGCMGCLDKDRWFPLINQAGPSLVADGLITETDLQQFFDLLKDPAFVDIPQVTISVWGRRPALSADDGASIG